MRIGFAAAALSVFLPAALLALSACGSAPPSKCEHMNGETVSLSGVARAPTYNPARNETAFMLVDSGAACEAIDVVVSGPLDCGDNGAVHVQGKLVFDEHKIFMAHIENPRAVCGRQIAAPSQAPALRPAQN